jgi:hypothetical protein
MILPFTIVQLALACSIGLLCVVLGLLGRKPNDLTVLGLGLVEIVLIGQLVVAIIAPGAGNPPTGSLLEFWLYLGTAVVIPPIAIVWALVERSRWSNVVLGASAFAIAVMLWRMQQIWTLPGA